MRACNWPNIVFFWNSYAKYAKYTIVVTVHHCGYSSNDRIVIVVMMLRWIYSNSESNGDSGQKKKRRECTKERKKESGGKGGREIGEGRLKRRILGG